MSWDGNERRKGGSGLEKIKDDIVDIHTKVVLLVNKVDANHESLRKTINSMEELLKKHNETIFGNGQPGLKTKVSSLESMKQDFKTHTDNDAKVFIAFGTLLVTILLGIGKLVFF